MRRLIKSLLVVGACVWITWTSAGCGGEDEVRRYRVPSVAESDNLPPPASPGPMASGYDQNHDHDHNHDHGHDHTTPRMIVAIIEHEGQNWFFRMLGPAADIPPEVEHFVMFLQSVQFTDSGPTFTVPDHWQQLQATGLRYAAFRFGHAGHPIELTVVPLDAQAGDLLDNVNRWRGQLNLAPMTGAGLPSVVMHHELSGREVVIVDLDVRRETVAGEGGGAAPGGFQHPPTGAAADVAGVADGVRVRYDTPPGWRDREATGMRRASLAIMSGEQMVADVSVIPLSGDAGGMLNNVNRWRGEVGLEPVDQATLESQLVPVTIDGGAAAVYVDLAGEASDSGEPRRTLAAIHRRGDQTWFVKMTGDAEVVGQHREQFEAFVDSIRFDEQDPQGYGNGP